uniref:Grass carp reovirus (GCRV)-induced gene 2p n=3 Tax=Lepisosteus oculatus TaxID=7918 RepID=W5NMV3_LEPOC
ADMSVEFFGWEVQYDDDQHLAAEQEPKAGRLYTMYHGTSVSQARNIIAGGFRQSPDGMLGPGVYVSRNPRKAERYPLQAPATDKVVLKLRVDTGRVKRIDTDNHPLQKTWHSHGYDTAWVPPNCGMKAVPSGLEEDCVWDPSKVEVIDVTRAPDANTQAELKGLIAQQQKGKRAAAAGADSCRLCKRRADSAHPVERCWGCGKSICTYMPRHQC